MEEDVKGLGDYLAILKRRRWQLIIPAVLIFAVAAAAAFLLPAVYQSNATILIEQQEIPPDLVRSTVTSYAAQRIQVISQRVMTTAKLGEIVERLNLYAAERKKDPLSAVVEQMRKEIKLDMVDANVVDARGGGSGKATIAFTLAYQSESPQVAQKVTNEIVSLYLNENLKTRREAARETAKFLNAEADKLAQQIATIEARLAVFKEKHPENLPEQAQVNLQLLRSTEDRLRANDQAIQSIEEQRTYLQSQLAQLEPRNPVIARADGRMVTSPAERLKALEAQYTINSARLTEKHPEQVGLKREMEAVRAEMVAAEKDKKEDPKADNPVYIQIKTQLQVLEGQHRAREEETGQLKQKLAALEQLLSEAPQIEREYRVMVRDHESALGKYRELKAKLLTAELAETLETESKGERFVLIEPPQVPNKPLKPNRLAIVFLGTVFAFGGGVGNVALRESLDHSLRGARALAAVTGAPPIGVIPYITAPGEVAARRRRRRFMILLALVGVVAAIAAVHFFYQPLDLLWFKVLRRIEMLQGG